jgi:hypothetical protein
LGQVIKNSHGGADTTDIEWNDYSFWCWGSGS